MSTPRNLPGRLRGGLVASAAVLMLAVLTPVQPAHAAHPAAAATTAAMPASWWQQFDDPVLTALLAPVAAQDSQRAQALARQWVAVRVYHLQGASADALARLARAEQARLMDLPADTAGRDEQLSRVAEQLAQTQRFTVDRAARRDQAIAAVAQLTGQTPEQLVARIATPLSDGRLPHLVAEPPTVRVTLSAQTSEQAQRLTTLHGSHNAALQADRAVLAARRVLTLAQAQAQVSAPQGEGANGATAAAPTDAATFRATQALLVAVSSQAAAAGDLALAWLDYLAIATPATTPGGNQTAARGGAKPA